MRKTWRMEDVIVQLILTWLENSGQEWNDLKKYIDKQVIKKQQELNN